MVSKIVTEKGTRRPVLHQVCAEVLDEDEAIYGEARAVAAKLVDTLKAHPDAVGLSAPQIGALVRVIAVRTDFEHNEQVVALLNPVVERRVGWRMVDEGCLSLPKRTFRVQRSQVVCVRAQSSSDGAVVKMTARGTLAQALEHEVDHLNGILISDKGTERDPAAKVIDPWAKG
jgi:peptide deformylase